MPEVDELGVRVAPTVPKPSAEVQSAADSAPRYSAADFAFVTIREPEHVKSPAALLMHAQGKSGNGASGATASLPGITNTTANKSSYSVMAYGRGGIYGNHINALEDFEGQPSGLPHGLYVFSSTPPHQRIRDVGPPGSPEYPSGLGGLTAENMHYILRMIPVPPKGPQTSLQAESQSVGSIILPRPYGSGRSSPSNTLTISEWRVDTQFSGATGLLGRNWLEAYIAAWETLATPHPLLGRKPQLSLKFGGRWWGLGQTALYLDSIEVERDYYEAGVTASAVMNLRFSEVVV